MIECNRHDATMMCHDSHRIIDLIIDQGSMMGSIDYVIGSFFINVSLIFLLLIVLENGN